MKIPHLTKMVLWITPLVIQSAIVIIMLTVWAMQR